MTPTKNGMPNWPIDFAKRTIVFLGFLALEILRLRLVFYPYLQIAKCFLFLIFICIYIYTNVSMSGLVL